MTRDVKQYQLVGIQHNGVIYVAVDKETTIDSKSILALMH